MSRSRKKPYIKDKPRNQKRTSLYWRTIRRVWKNEMNSSKFWDEDFSFKNRKVIYNQYNYCDYWFIVEETPQMKRGKWWSNYLGWTEEEVKKAYRK